MSLFKDCFGDLDEETQAQLKLMINKIEEVVGLKSKKEEFNI